MRTDKRDTTYLRESTRLLELCNKHYFDVEEVLSKKRLGHLVDIRLLYMLDAQRRGIPLVKIAGIINRDHANVIHHLKTFNERYVGRKEFRDMCQREEWALEMLDKSSRVQRVRIEDKPLEQRRQYIIRQIKATENRMTKLEKDLSRYKKLLRDTWDNN